MVAENTKKTPQGSASMRPATKRATPKKPTTTTPVKQSKPAPLDQRTFHAEGFPQKIRKESLLSILLTKEDELYKNLTLRRIALLPQRQAPVGGVTIRDPVSETTPKLHEVVGKGKAVVSEEQVAHSLIDISCAPKGDKDQDEVDTSTVTSGVSIPVSDPVKAHEALAGPDPEPMEEDQTGSDSGKLHFMKPEAHTENGGIDDIQKVIIGSMSSMKNLDDTFNFGDQFLHDKPTEDDQEKSKAREESDSTIPDPSHQTETSTPPVIAPFTEVSSSKPSSLVTPPPINTEATTITTSLPESLHFIALQLTQVPTAVDNYLGTKLDDSLLKSDVADKVKTIKRKHDSDDDEDDDDDDDGPSAGSNQGRSTKRRKSDSAASGSAKPPPKADDQSLKKPRESEASASKQHPSLSSTGMADSLHKEGCGVDSSMHRSDPESEHSEQSTDDMSKQDEGNVSDMEDTDNAHIPKILTVANAYASTLSFGGKHASKEDCLILGRYQMVLQSTAKEELCKNRLHTKQSIHVDKKPGDQESCGDLQLGIESYKQNQPERPNWVAAEILLQKGTIRYDGTLTRVMEKLDQMVKDFHLYEYNKGMVTRNGQVVTREDAKTYHSYREKTLQIQKDLSKYRKLC
ncbi:hypothetical protein Tco_0178696 [Tanacetum coccineum]